MKKWPFSYLVTLDNGGLFAFCKANKGTKAPKTIATSSNAAKARSHQYIYYTLENVPIYN